jgi:hypothetical protein
VRIEEKAISALFCDKVACRMWCGKGNEEQTGIQSKIYFISVSVSLKRNY